MPKARSHETEQQRERHTQDLTKATVGRAYTLRVPLPGELVRTCPYCSASPAPFALTGALIPTTGAEGEQRRWWAAGCPACGGVVIFELVPGTDSVESTYPESVAEWEVRFVPMDVQAIWNEAVKVYS